MPLSTINNKSIADGTIVATDILDGTISSSKLVASNIAGDRLAANTLSNTVFQTGSVESYLRGANLDFGMRNRIINGAMVIDQRNAGASVTPTDNQYTLDRWYFSVSQTSKLTSQQNAGSVTPPVGFINYLGVTSSSSYSVTSSDYFGFRQSIEGLNVADLGWGTASARPVTLSFWVRSSLTGSFGGSLFNSAANRSYPFSYTISTANTWEQKSVTIAGDTTGTWLTTNGNGIQVYFSLGGGTSRSGTANAWTGGTWASQPTGSTSVVGTNAATFYVTGVQLEEGSVPTSFEYRQYGTELALCQRYFWQIQPNGTQYSAYAAGYAAGTTDVSLVFRCPVITRTPCTGITASGTATWIVQQASGNLFNPTVTFVRANQTNITVNANLSGLTSGGGAVLIDGNNASYIYFNGMEL